MTLALSLLVYAVAASLYDLRTRRVPIWVTLPVLAAGILAYFPGALETWLVCAILFGGWKMGWLGGGDAKLWMALLWCVPTELATPAVFVFFVSFILTAFLQMAARWCAGKPATGVRSPGAWRAIPFTLWLLVVSLIVG